MIRVTWSESCVTSPRLTGFVELRYIGEREYAVPTAAFWRRINAHRNYSTAPGFVRVPPEGRLVPVTDPESVAS